MDYYLLFFFKKTVTKKLSINKEFMKIGLFLKKRFSEFPLVCERKLKKKNYYYSRT
jgi:hypothetical protein